jgi:hypothetical protein
VPRSRVHALLPIATRSARSAPMLDDPFNREARPPIVASGRGDGVWADSLVSRGSAPYPIPVAESVGLVRSPGAASGGATYRLIPIWYRSDHPARSAADGIVARALSPHPL